MKKLIVLPTWILVRLMMPILLKKHAWKNRKYEKTIIMSKKLGDYDIWYQPCENCGYDTGKSTSPREGNKTCWRCGNFIKRDYSARALKPECK